MTTEVVLPLLQEECILPALHANSRDDALQRMGQFLVERSYCHATFPAAILAREYDYPSGLPFAGEKVAIPHTDAVHVRTPVLLIARLVQPVLFNTMGNPDETIPVQLIVMMALHGAIPAGNVLQALITLFQDGEMMQRLMAGTGRSEMYHVLHTALQEVHE
jgi:PTS system galactitol-specific IIA component